MFNTVPDTQGNPIFSSYSTRSANFNENMDEFVKAPNDLYIEEQQKKKPVESKTNINNEALSAIPDMPDFLREEYDEVYKLPEWFEKLNVATPEEIEEWKNKGGMGIAEAWEKNNKWRAFLPYANTTKDAADAITASVLFNRAKKGEELTEKQTEILVDYLRDIKELQVRGFTFGGGTVNAILTSIPYLEEFGIGLATSESGVGLAALGKTISTIGAKKAARKAVEAALKEAAIKSAAPAAGKSTVPLSVAKGIYRDTLARATTSTAVKNISVKEALKETKKALPNAVVSSAKFGLTKMPHNFAGGIADKQFSTGIYVTDYGDAVFTSSENLATSIMKALGESTFEALTETAGWTFSPVASYFAKPIQKIMPKKFFTEFEKLVTSRYGMPAAQALKKYGYDGVIEEMGEELLNRFLCQTFGINGLDEYNFDGFMNNVLYADNPSQWGQEFLSFAAIGAAGHAVAGAQSKAVEEWNKRQYQNGLGVLAERANKYIYSPEQFYLEQGLIKVKGSQSLAEQKLRDIWSSQNIDESLQDDVLKNMSEAEIRTELKKAIESRDVDIAPEAAAERIEKDLTERFMSNKTFGDEKKARTVAALFAAPLQKLSETTGLSLSEVMAEEMPDIHREAEQAATDNGRYIQVDGRIEEIFKELNELPDNFNDEKYLERLMKEVDILSKARDGVLTDAERDEAIQFANFVQQNGEVEFANELKEILNIEDEGQLFQAASSAGAENIENAFGDTLENITEAVKADVLNIVVENNLSEDEFRFEDIRVYGSYSKGSNKDTSDLDFLVQYSGSMREDDAFNMFADAGLTLEDVNGKSVKVDINPVNIEKSGTIDEHLADMDALYQEDNNKLIMAHATKAEYIDDIIKSGEFIAPSLSITKKGSIELSTKKFGDVLFIRNPRKIDFQNDNIYDRDIYSPRLPEPSYKLSDGIVISPYEYSSMQREWKGNQERFIQRYGKTFDEYFKNAEKMLFLGYTPSGNRRYKPYKPNFILEYIKKNKLVGGEDTNYGLSSFLARLAKQQTSKDLLKRTASEALQDRENSVEEYDKLRDEYADLMFGELGDYYLFEGNSWQKISDEDFTEIMVAIATNNKRKLSKYIDTARLPKELYNTLKDFTKRALALPRSYFEAKPLRKVDLSEFPYALAEKGTLSDKQKKGLKDWGVKVIEYEQGEMNATLQQVEDAFPEVYFQSAYHGTPHIVDLTDDFEKSPTIQEVKNYINKIIEEGLKFATANPDFVVDIKGGNRVKKKILNASNYKKLDKMSRKRHNKYIMSLEKLLANAEYSGAKENTKKDKKPNIEKYHYFTTNVKVGSKVYKIVFDTEEYKNKNQLRSDYAKRSFKETEADTNSITDNAAGFNPKTVHLYNITEIKKPETYYHSGDEAIQTNMLYDNISPRRLRNMNIKGAFIPAENLIELFKNADESTIVHEFAHWWLSRLEKYAPNNEELALDLEEVRKFVKNDGGAFTREQHEKFARGFEAYIRNGSAKNNRLKRIFEDFKNALIQIYDSIKQLVYAENGNEYSFSEADVANLERLFERLLTTENERIKKTVFDRCDDINDRIQQIKERQEEEMKELDEIWKENIEANNRASDKKRQVQEYLDLAERAVSKVPKEVKELKKRYKDVTLSILSAATGYDKRYIANPRNRERVQMALEHADDKITASGGMRAEWQEFYADTGVSFDNDEIGGDYELANQAFDVLAAGTYNFNNLNEDEIGRFYGKFEYLYDKVLSLKGEEKTTALGALYSLFNDMPAMPDEVTADFIEKLSKIETVYEESQRYDFNRKGYPNIPVVQQLQYYVTNKLSELKVYDPNVRYKVRISKSHSLYKAIKHATSVNKTKKIVRRINEYVISDLENQAKSILHKEIQKQIKTSSKLVKVGAIKKGKFDWKTNTVFAELSEMNKMKQEDAFREFSAAVELDRAAAGEDREHNDENIVSTPKFETDFQSNLKRKFLEYRSSKIKDLNLAATRSLLEDIMTLKFEGRRAKNAQELEKRLQKENMKTDLAQRVRLLKGNRLAKNVAKFIMGENLITSEKTLVNWETALNALFGKEVAQRYSLLKLESDAEVYAFKHYNEFCRKAIDIYGLNNPANAAEKAWNAFNKFVDFANIQPLVKLMQEYEEEVYNYKEVTYSKETGEFVESGVQLSRAEIITLYAWSLNEGLEQRLFTQYGVNQIKHMFNEVLSDKDKQLAWLLIDTCEKMYDDNNEVFIRTMGLSLPKVQNYFPSNTVRVGSEIDMLHEKMVRSNNPSFTKERKVCNRIKMKPEQPLSILLPHINKTARYVILSERVNYLNAIFKDGTVRAAIKEVFDGVETPDGKAIKSGQRAKGKRNKKNRTTGDRIHDTLLNQLGCSTFENYARGINVGKSFMDYVATNYITSRIGGNLKVAFGQLTSMINYCENMPSGLWAEGFAECLAHPEGTIKFMLENCPYLEARLAGNSMNEIMQRITDETDKFRTLRNFCCTNTKYGDLIAIAFGGKPYVDYLISQGLSKEEAFEKFVEDTMRSQQAGQASATSIWQKKQAENPLSRMMFAFNNTTLQYERKFLDAIAARARGDISTKEFVKIILIYKVFNPLLFSSFLTNLSFMTLIRGLSGGDDDSIEKFGVDVVSSMLFANLAAYGYLGMGLSTIGTFLLTLVDKKEYKPFLKTIPIIGDLEEIGKNILMKNEITLADYIEAMALVVDDATGIPATRLVNSAGGIGDIFEGEFGVGLSRIFGYGKYRANQAWKGEAPQK